MWVVCNRCESEVDVDLDEEVMVEIGTSFVCRQCMLEGF